MRSPSSVFCSVSEHLLPASSRPAGSHFQQSWQLFRTDRGRPSLQNPRFQAFRAQNRHFCALFAFGTPVLGHFEHKIEIFVRFCPPKPPFSGISSTKSAFLCQKRRFFPGFGPFRAQNRAFCARADGKLASGTVPRPSSRIICHPMHAPLARRQPHLAEIWRWRRQSVQMGRQICVCLSSSSMW